jgi:hypothetical protein
MKSRNDTWLGGEEVANFFEGREAFKWHSLRLFNTNLWYHRPHVLHNQSTSDKRKKLQFVLYAVAQLFFNARSDSLHVFHVFNILWL